MDTVGLANRSLGDKGSLPTWVGLAAAWAAALLTAGPWVGLHPAISSGAEALAPVTTTLDPPRYAMTAAGDGKHLFMFGGANAEKNMDEILRYDPRRGTLETAGARLPSPRFLAAAASDGRHIYLFGGAASAGPTLFDDIVRYDPGADRVQVMSARLPLARYGASAVWTGEVFLVLGGRDANVASLRDILKYDPRADTLTRLDAALPEGRYGAGEFWDGEAAYLLGGWAADAGNLNGRELDTIVRFDLASNEPRVMKARLPFGRLAAATIWDGRAAYLIGGVGAGSNLAQIVRYVPQADVVSVLSEALPSGRRWVAAASDGTRAFVFGGYDDVAFKRDIVGLDTSTHEPVAVLPSVPAAECVAGGAPVTLDASASFDLDGDPVRFTWSAPGVVLDDPGAPAPAGFFPLGSTLVVVAVSDGSETATASTVVQVVDRVAPALELLRPVPGMLYVNDTEAGGPFRVASGSVAAVGPLTFAAEALDACGVAFVRFQLRFQSPNSVLQNHPAGTVDAAPPFVFRFDPRPYDSGEWRADVTAEDLAGNPSDIATRLVHEVGTSCKVGGPVEQVCGLVPSSP